MIRKSYSMDGYRDYTFVRPSLESLVYHHNETDIEFLRLISLSPTRDGTQQQSSGVSRIENA